MSTDQDTENLIQAKGANVAPRVTPEDVDASIVGETFTVLPSGRVTVCELTLRNGFTVRGESAVVFIENFNAEIGKDIARNNARSQVWQLLGYQLRDKLASAPSDFKARVRAEAAELDERVKKLAAFFPTDTFSSLPADERDRLTAQLAAMQDYSNVLSERISAFAG